MTASSGVPLTQGVGLCSMKHDFDLTVSETEDHRSGFAGIGSIRIFLYGLSLILLHALKYNHILTELGDPLRERPIAVPLERTASLPTATQALAEPIFPCLSFLCVVALTLLLVLVHMLTPTEE